MSALLESVERINTLKNGIEATTGESYNDLTVAVQALKNGYGSSNEPTLIRSGSFNENTGWSFYSDGRFVISGTGATLDCSSSDAINGNLEWSDLRVDVTSIIVEEGITAIGKYICYGFENATQLTIAEGVTAIGIRAFAGCTSLSDIKLPESLTTINNYAFYSCESLKQISIPKSVIKIGTNAFSSRYNNLTTVFYGGTRSDWDNIEMNKKYNDELINAKLFCEYVPEIIDVTELPTENIDENAVYRLTENIQVDKNEIYQVDGRYVYSVVDMMIDGGVPASNIHVYVVDELPADMKSSDVETFTELHFYLLRTDGKSYMHTSGYGVITLAIMFYQDPSYDKGFTENVYAETEDGIYTTFEAYKDIVRWFVRKNGEWEEITAYVKFDNPHGLTDTNVVSGDITAVAYSASDLLERAYTEIDESWFLKADGTYVNRVSNYVFAYSNSLKTATLPSFIDIIGVDVFTGCPMLKTVTLKSKPTDINEYAFRNNMYATVLTTVNVPWSEGEVEGAPWGATNATINYNYTGE